MSDIFLHADDFGRSELITSNIYKCIKYGSINSISVMMGFGKFYFKKIKKIKKLKKLKIKLHINLTEEKKQKFAFKENTFIKLLLIKFSKGYKEKRCRVFNEIESQLISFKKEFSLKKIYIDSHEHVHIIPWIFDILIELSSKHNIVEIRLPNESFFICNFKDLFNKNYLLNVIKLIVIKFLLLLNKKKNSKKTNFVCFTGIMYSGIQNLNSILNGFKLSKKNEKKNGTEILVHPGFSSSKEKNIFQIKYYQFYSSLNRIVEYCLCCDKKIMKEIKKIL